MARDKLDRLLAQAAALAEEIKKAVAEAEIGLEEPTGHGRVVRFRVQHGKRSYSFAAIRVGPRGADRRVWYLTGSDTHRGGSLRSPATWGEIVEVAEEATLEVAPLHAHWLRPAPRRNLPGTSRVSSGDDAPRDAPDYWQDLMPD